jgi:sulfur dioxygenase
MLFHQIRNAPTGAYSYLLGDHESRLALVVDPVDQNLNVVLALAGDLGLEMRYILMTHAHAASAADAIRLRGQAGGEIVTSIACQLVEADRRVGHGDYLTLGDEVVHVVGTPGHTQCSVCYRWRDRLFTGDTLLIGACGDVESADADAGSLFDSVTRRLFMLPPETLIFPGYDACGRTVSTVAEEKAGNPLFSGRNREAFVTMMSAAPHPAPAPAAPSRSRL